MDSASPTGTYRIHLESSEVHMSHWIDSPTLIESATGLVIFRFASSSWSLDRATWRGDAMVVLTLRKYPGAHRPSSFDVAVDCVAGTAAILDGPAEPLATLESQLDARILAGA